MTHAVLVRSGAERDAERAVDWYVEHAPEHADRLLDDLDATIRAIAGSPHAFRALRRDARRAALQHFPYLVWYRVHDEHRVVEILAIVHARQDRERMADRLE